ncbi:hypothetical protein SNE40_016441 [Patella caerulea]|uniref:Ig-like domain-containing protein n=1 Tax=Patella caerulea TaxID=87958 RepID=A0AAN8JBW7_PATCE
MEVQCIYYVVIVAVLATVGADWSSDPEWSFQVYMNEDTSLRCNDSMVNIHPSAELWWHLPSGAKIHGYSVQRYEKYELMDDNGLRGGILKIKDVKSSDHGLYICMVYNGSQMTHKINRGLNLYGHLDRDNFNLYRTQVITAFVAALVFVVPLIAICFIYHFRYMSDAEKERKRNNKKYFNELHKALENGSDYPTKPYQHYDNPSYDTHL